MDPIDVGLQVALAQASAGPTPPRAAAAPEPGRTKAPDIHMYIIQGGVPGLQRAWELEI